MRLSIGAPCLTAILAKACSSRRRVAIVEGLQGRMRLPLAPLRILVKPARYFSISARNPSGNASQGICVCALIGGSIKRWLGHPFTFVTQAFQARAMHRRAA